MFINTKVHNYTKKKENMGLMGQLLKGLEREVMV
jgi:hypothetical protein